MKIFVSFTLKARTGHQSIQRTDTHLLERLHENLHRHWEDLQNGIEPITFLLWSDGANHWNQCVLLFVYIKGCNLSCLLFETKTFSSSAYWRMLPPVHMSPSHQATARTSDRPQRRQKIAWAGPDAWTGLFHTLSQEHECLKSITPCKWPQVLTDLLPHSRSGGFPDLLSCSWRSSDTKVWLPVLKPGSPLPCHEPQGSFSGVQREVLVPRYA